MPTTLPHRKDEFSIIIIGLDGVPGKTVEMQLGYPTRSYSRILPHPNRLFLFALSLFSKELEESFLYENKWAPRASALLRPPRRGVGGE